MVDQKSIDNLLRNGVGIGKHKIARQVADAGIISAYSLNKSFLKDFSGEEGFEYLDDVAKSDEHYRK